jgi:hypothetical protein
MPNPGRLRGITELVGNYTSLNGLLGDYMCKQKGTNNEPHGLSEEPIPGDHSMGG